MKKIHKQIIIIVLLITTFVLLDLGIYLIFTRRCMSDNSEGMQAKSIELNEYLPFEEDSQVVKIDSEMKLSGDLPVIDGAAALYPVCSGMVYALYPEESVNFDGQDFSKESALQMNNTRGAYKGIVDGDVDLIICAKPSQEQLDYAKQQGVTLNMVPIGKEAFVFIVNAKNPVSDLSVEQIRGIYNGTYTNWKQLGGENELIAAMHRNEGSGSQTAMLSFMNGEKMVVDYDSFIGSAIGFSFRFYVEGIVENGGVKMLSVNGVYPNEENIRNDSYPIVSNFYAVYREDNDNPNIPVLIEWLLSSEGQKMIEETGYVGVNVAETEE
ncbi:MAG: substrate-binding domain-containing protein [Lachnospiraceae bacterium]|nr:substrate-binding domain-containing protein [Lachnospiraceae bacterium]